MERSGIYRVDGGESRRYGAAGSRWRTRADGRPQGGGVVWRHGGVDNRPCKVNALIHILKMGSRKMVAATSGACTCGALRVCWTGAPVLNCMPMSEVRTNGSDHGHPVIKLIGVATLVAKKVASR